MIQAFYSGQTALQARQTAMDTISNNIANVNTTGFEEKSQRFGDLLYTSMSRPQDADYQAKQAGSGASVSAVENKVVQGSAQQTGAALDYCPRQNGYFAVQDDAGNKYFTRDGSFGIVNRQDGAYLSTESGMLVTGSDGNPIRVINGEPQTEPGVFMFANSAGLSSQGENLFSQTVYSGAPEVSDEGVQNGSLEGSNVDLTQQMEQLIVTQRGFQMDARLEEVADQVTSMANDLK